MSRAKPRWILACALVVLGLSTPPAIVGQEAAPDLSAVESQLIQRIDSLLPVYAEARLLANRAEAERRERLRLASMARVDTISVGPLRIVTPGEQAELASTMFSEVLAEYADFEGSPAFASALITFQWANDLAPIYIDEGRHWRVEHKRWRPAFMVRNTMRQALGAMLQNDVLGTAVGNWANQAITPPTDLTNTYRELTTIPSKVSQACFAGDGRACWSALGLDVDLTDLATFYTPEERRAFVLRILDGYPPSYRLREHFQPCLAQADYDTCDRLLTEDFWVRRWLAPLSIEARVALIWVAVDRGGEGAWARLVGTLEDPDATASQALQAASQMTPEELGLAWRAEIFEHRPTVYAGSLPARAIPVLWIVLFAGLAMRSTRWRLG